MDSRNHDIDFRNDDLIDKSFLGMIEDINDPKKEGRCRLRVFGMHDGLETQDLPWAYPIQKSAFFGQDGKSGSLSIPKRGSVVAVKFNNGNPYSPEYYSVHELADDAKEELSKEGEYAGTHIMLFDGDEQLKIWFTISKGITVQLKDSRINIGQDRAITIEHQGSQSVIELRGGEINITSNSTINLTSGSEIQAASNDIWINGNYVKIGHNPVIGPAILGDKLYLMLDALAAAVDAKWPVTPGAAQSIVNLSKTGALSETVKVSK